jgi:hypothetical protein
MIIEVIYSSAEDTLQNTLGTTAEKFKCSENAIWNEGLYYHLLNSGPRLHQGIHLNSNSIGLYLQGHS